MVFSTSPPCLPIPGINSGMLSSNVFLIFFNSSGYVAPTTAPHAPILFHSLIFFATCKKRGLFSPFYHKIRFFTPVLTEKTHKYCNNAPYIMGNLPIKCDARRKVYWQSFNKTRVIKEGP